MNYTYAHVCIRVSNITLANLTMTSLYHNVLRDIVAMRAEFSVLKAYCTAHYPLTFKQQTSLLVYTEEMARAVYTDRGADTPEDIQFRETFAVECLERVVSTHVVSTRECHARWFMILLNVVRKERASLETAAICATLVGRLYTYMSNTNKKAAITMLLCSSRGGRPNRNLVQICLDMAETHASQYDTPAWFDYVDAVMGIVYPCIEMHRMIPYFRMSNLDPRLVVLMSTFLVGCCSAGVVIQEAAVADACLEMLTTSVAVASTSTTAIVPNAATLISLAEMSDQFIGDGKAEAQCLIADLFACFLDRQRHRDDDALRPAVVKACSRTVATDSHSAKRTVRFLHSVLCAFPDLRVHTPSVIIDALGVATCPPELVEYMADLAASPHHASSLCSSCAVFEAWMGRYDELCPHNPRRFASVVYTFMRIGNGCPDTARRYRTILTRSGYLDTPCDDEDTVCKRICKTIQYNYMCASLVQKCTMWVADNANEYAAQHIDDVFEIMYIPNV